MAEPRRRLSLTAEAALVAGTTWRDLRRRPGGWVATLLTAALFALLVGALGLQSERVQDRVEGRSFKVSIGGDLAGGRVTRDRLLTPRLNFVESTEVAEDVAAVRSSAGLELSAGIDRRLDAGESVEVRLFVRQSANTSVEAYNTLVVRFQELELEAAARGQGRVFLAGGGPEVVVHDLPRDEHLNRVQLARQLAPISALLCIGVITAVASVLGAARERRSIEPLLALPVRRSAIALGIALGAYPLACLQLLAAVFLLVLTAAIPGSAQHQAGGTLAVMLAGGAVSAMVLALVATAFGCVAGALGTGGDDAVSLGDLLSVGFVVVGVIAFSAPTITGPIAAAVPVLGPVLLIRDLVSGRVDPVMVVITLVVAAATFTLLVAAAGRRLDDEKRLARAIR